MLPAAIRNASSAGTPANSRSANGRVLGQSHSMCGKSVANMMWSDAHVVAQLDGHPLDVLHAELDVLRARTRSAAARSGLKSSRRSDQCRWRSYQ